MASDIEITIFQIGTIAPDSRYTYKHRFDSVKPYLRGCT